MFGPSFTVGLGGTTFLTAWPVHTQATENGITISASTEDGSSAAWKGHDGSGGGSSWIATAGVGQWWKVRFEGYRRVTHITLDPYDADTTTFSLLGSNDDTNWTTLKTGLSNQTAEPVNSDVPWLYFRLLATAISLSIAAVDEVTFTFAAN